MALDWSKIKGISDEVKAKLVKVTIKDEFDALVKAENGIRAFIATEARDRA